MNLPVPYDPQFAAWQLSHTLLWQAGQLVGPVIIADDFFDQVIDPIFGRPVYYDRQGQPLSLRRWGELREVGPNSDHYGPGDYVYVGNDRVGEAQVSTVWMGIDLSFSDGPPIIFESMVFGGRYDQYTMRYATEAEAFRGHREAVEDLRAGLDPWWAYGGSEADEWHSPGN